MHLLHVGQEGGALSIVADGIANGFIGSSPCGCYNAVPSYSLQAFAVAVTVDTLRACPAIRLYLLAFFIQLDVCHYSRHNLGVSRVFHACAAHVGQQVGVIFRDALCVAIAHAVPVTVGHDRVAEQIVFHVLSAVIARYHRVVADALRALGQAFENLVRVKLSLLRELEQVAGLQAVAELEPFCHVATVHDVALREWRGRGRLRLAEQLYGLVELGDASVEDGLAVVVGRHGRVAERFGVRNLAIDVEQLHEAESVEHVSHRHIVVCVFCLCLVVEVVKV